MRLSALLRRLKREFSPSIEAASGESERTSSRNLRAVVTGTIGAIARVGQIGASLITIPIVIRYLGNERFGLWMTISSVLAMAAFADFGIGNGVVNTVAKAFGHDDMDGVRRAVSSGVAVLGAISIALLSVVYATFRFVPWADVFRVTSLQARAEAGPALMVFATCFALNIPLDIVQRVQLGLQEGFRYSLWQLCGSTLALGGVIGGVRFHLGLPALVAALAGAPVLATTLNAVHFFGFVRPDLRPSIGLVSQKVIAEIAKLGGLFFVLQVVASVSYSADNFIIARTLGALYVPEYSIPQRMFALTSLMSGMLIAPLWPAYGEAISRGDMHWVRRTLGVSLLLVLAVSSVCATVLLLIGPQLIHWWVGSRIHPPFILLLGLAVWSVIECCGNALSMFLNGAAAMRFQISLSIAFGVVCITVKLMFIRHFGLVGVPWATIVSYVLIEATPWIFIVPHLLRKLETKSTPLVLLERET